MPRFFNPEVFNILCFDQRGCGRSEPNGSLSKNTTDKLISDLDLITTRFGLERYILFGDPGVPPSHCFTQWNIQDDASD